MKLRDPVTPQPIQAAAPVPRAQATSAARRLRTWRYLPPLCVALVATIPRVYALSRLGLNSDEAVYAGQAATLAGAPGMNSYFSLFRAHPLLVQFMLSILFRLTGVHDGSARLLVALVFGVGGVIAAYVLAKRLYGERVGVVAALLLAVVPYHVLVSRQILLDAPVTFFVTVAFIAAHRWRWTRKPGFLAVAGIATGAATLSKEIGFIIGAVLLVYLLAVRMLNRKAIKSIAVFGVGFGFMILPFLASRLIRASNAGATVLWQFGRAPNHTPDYFPRVLAQYVGLPVLGLAVLGFVVMIVRRSDSDWLPLSWLVLAGAFFQLWPTKLISYLMIVMPPLAMAAAIGFDTLVTAITNALHRLGLGRGFHSKGSVRARLLAGYHWVPSRVATVVVCVLGVLLLTPLAWASLSLARSGPAEGGRLAHFGVSVQTFAGGRELGEWAKRDTPPNSMFLTLGPSLGNIISFYSERHFTALSVSPDLRNRNPAYVPIPNPDLALRTSAVDYVVWDKYSASRSTFTSKRLLRYVRSYAARPVFAVWGRDEQRLRSGTEIPPGESPRIIVYVVTGASPRLASSGGLPEGSR